MKDLPAIARYMRLPEEQLRFPVELLNQGYEPNYLATYRPDELGGVDVQTLAKLKRAVEYEGKLAAHKLRVQQGLERDQHWTDTVGKVIAECTSISQTDSIARYLRGKRSAKSFADTHPNVEKLGQAILVMQSDAPKDFPAWVVEQIGCTPEQVDELVQQTKYWMQLLMCEDAQLILQLQRAVLRNANVSVQILPEPSKSSDATAEPSAGDTTPAPAASESPVNVVPTAEPAPEIVVEEGVPTPAGDADASPEAASETAPVAAAAPQPDAVVAPLIEQFHQGRKQNKGLKTKSLSEKQLSPRQRRRRWLRSIVESYAKLKKPLRALTPYQVLMFSRGIRSQIMQMQFHQDLRPLIQACRDSLCSGRHPMHPLLMEVAEGGLKEIILPRLHQDVVAIFEEDANQELIEAAVLHLQSSLLQRPVRGHRILLIDAVGQKTAAVAIVDASGNVLATGELPCNSSKPDVVAQNVTTLGQWVHAHHVTLIALSNGHARRYLIHSVAELMKQSSEGSLYWTILDRAGADAFCLTRTSLVELPRISRRHRSAVWLAWKLQDPLRQILKVEPARLRLGSYQRELPQQELETALHESISAAITKAGVDVLSADVDVLKRIPGMTDAAAKRIAADRQAGNITNRETLMRSLRETLSENQARQAIGFLRVYGSENTLDGTIIHPEDYRLAQRLIAHAELPAPPATPEGWTKPDYEKIAAAHAAVASMALESTLSEEVDAYGFEASSVEINPNFGVLDTPSAEDVEGEGDSQTPSEASDASATASSESESPSEELASESVTQEEIAAVADDGAVADAPADAAVSDAPTASDDADASSNAAEARTSHRIPEVTFEPLSKPALKVDAEKLARSWQVGRAKLMTVAAALQFPFADSRDFQFPVPLQAKVPKLDTLPPGTMLQAFVIGVADFGVFVELGPDCSGLVHISRLAAEFVEDPHQ
ncbi:MAG: S1 RNA-binding domain-containing protein, partial [Pirellula sp.]